MSRLPSFLRGASSAPIQTIAGPVRAGSFGVAAHGAAWRYGLLHDRQADMLLWITRGQGRAIVGGLRRGLSMHHALYVPSGTLFALDLPVTAQALFVENPNGLTDRLPDTPVLLRVRDSLAQAELTGEIDAMARELQMGRPRALEALEARMRLIGVWLHRQIQDGAAQVAKDGPSEKLVQRYAAIVSRDYRKATPMADHAAALDVTPTHLTRICRHCTGVTASGMLAQRRLHAARMALETSATPVHTIASDLGFATAAYFSRFVQTQTGHSPTHLRKTARRAP